MEGLLASGVVVHFGGLVALDGVRVEAARGGIAGLIGPNGAGKTTMFNVICGFQAPDAGTVTLDGVDITARPSGPDESRPHVPARGALPVALRP